MNTNINMIYDSVIIR